MDHNNPTHDHSNHSSKGQMEHEGHDKHAGHNVSDFWKRFIICSVVSIPVLALSQMIQQWIGFSISFPGDRYLLAILSTFIFLYGGYPFLNGLYAEIRD